MSTSINYKLAKLSAPLKEMPELFDKPAGEPGEIIARAILQNPTMVGKRDGHVRWAICNSRFFDTNIIEGDLAREGHLSWPRIEDGALTQDVLESNPFCHFFYDRGTQIAAFQGSTMNRAFPAMLAGLDQLLHPYIRDHGREPRSLPLSDDVPFLEGLRTAKRVYSVTFRMIPPNGYTRRHVRDTLSYISEATDAREVAVRLDANRGGTINPEATSIQEMTAECAEGNGSAEAPIRDPDGHYRKITTRTAPIVRQLATRSLDEVKRLLDWASAKVRM